MNHNGGNVDVAKKSNHNILRQQLLLQQNFYLQTDRHRRTLTKG